MAMVAEIALAESQRSLISEVGDSAKAMLAAEASAMEGSVVSVAEAAPETEKPKRGRRPARKAEAVVADEPVVAELVSAAEVAAPKKRGRVAKPKAEKMPEANITEAVPVVAPVAPPEAVKVEIKAEVAKVAPVVVAPVIVEPTALAVESTVLDPSQPKRGGWWQRAKDSFSGN